MDIKPGTGMFLGSVISIILSVALIWDITVTEDLMRKWIVWFIVILGFILFVGGYRYERRYGRKYMNIQRLKMVLI